MQHLHQGGNNPSGGSGGGGGGSPQQFCLRWNNYQSNLTNVFDQLLQSESFVDVTLACDGHSVKAHKMVLSACSPYFQTLFYENPCQHPIVIMRDIRWPELKAAVEFMYRGEINVSQEQIGPLLKVAESLKIRGLADVNGEQDVASATTQANAPAQPAAAKGGQDSWPSEGPPANKKRRRPSGERSSGAGSPGAESAGERPVETPPVTGVVSPQPPEPLPLALPLQQGGQAAQATPQQHQHSAADDLEIKPGIAEMIREEERAKLLESSHAWLGASTSSIAADSYQYQLQSMWQKCWNTNQSLVHNLRFRERGPLKSWRPETMAEAIFSVLKEGLSLSQAARKYDIPYPTFVLYANRVHNMLGPSADGGSDLRPKGRGRPQRILLGVWPDEHIRGVIRAVVFRDSHQIKDESHMAYPRLHDGVTIQSYPSTPSSNGGASTAGNPADGGGAVSPNAAAAAAAVAAVAQGLRQQMCSIVAASHGHDNNSVASLVNSLALATNGMPQHHMGGGSAGGHSMRAMSSPTGSIQDLRISPPSEPPLDSPLSSPLGLTVSSSMVEPSINMTIGGGMDLMTGAYKPQQHLQQQQRGMPPFQSPRPDSLFQEDIEELVKPMHHQRPKDTTTGLNATIKMEPLAECRGE